MEREAKAPKPGAPQRLGALNERGGVVYCEDIPEPQIREKQL